MRKECRYILLWVLACLLLTACDDRPKDVLSRSKMEDVLYDYHLTQGLIDQLPSDERYDQAQNYLNAVYLKHGITEAQFDSSITYYNRHTKELYKIYTNLKARYEIANEEIQLINGNNDMMAIFTTGGDTTNLWNSTPLFLLRSKPMLSHESFTLQADTSFRHHDQFILTFTPLFVHEPGDVRDINLQVGIAIHYASGKHIGATKTISVSGPQQLTIKATDDEDIKSISGHFYYQSIPVLRNFCLIDDVSLIRMHEKVAEPVKVDSVKTDSVVKDTMPKAVPQRMSPEELRLKNKRHDNIQIQTAPAVRTPNSIGPRRRTPQKRETRR